MILKNGIELKYNFPNSMQPAVAIVFWVGIKSVTLNKPWHEVLLLYEKEQPGGPQHEFVTVYYHKAPHTTNAFLKRQIN